MRSRRPHVALAVATAVVAAACSTGGSADRPGVAPTDATGAGSPSSLAPTSAPASSAPAPSSPPSPASTPPSSSATPVPATGDPIAEVVASWQVVGEGHGGPVQVLVDPDGRALVVEQAGRITTLSGREVVLDLTDRVTAGGERGLLGAAFHPDGDRLFVHYSGDGGGTVVSSLPADGAALDPAAETVLLRHDQPAPNHNGGALLFDPDGALVLGLGDGGAAGDRFGNGQDPSTVLGALLRFDADGDRLEPAAGNPFADGGGAPEVWAYGLRNPWRIAFDQARLYVADVGQDAVEEVSVLARDAVAGANFGWPRLEGTACFATSPCDAEGTVVPVAELRHADGACSIIGGVVVPVGHPTGLGGAYLYSDLCDTRLRALRVGDTGVESGEVESGEVESGEVGGASLPASPLGFGTGPDGQVWVGTADGRVLELVPG